MRRREFLIAGIKVSTAFLAAGPLRVRGAGLAPAWTVTAPPELDDSIALLAAYLVSYAPPSGDFPRTGGWRGSYDIVGWQGSTLGFAFSRSNPVLGGYSVERRAGPNVRYALDHSLTFGGFRTRVQARMQCGDGVIPSLTEWESDYEMHPVGRPARITRLQEIGRRSASQMEIRAGAGHRVLPTNRPVLPQWCIADALRSAPGPGAGVFAAEFDLLHDLTSFRPRQRLRPAGTLQATLRAENHSLRGYLLTGAGTEPTHYWVDAQGRTLIITGGLVAHAMTASATA